ncbi:ATP-binding protein [Frankia sp. AiPs1]|nr:ATP-binding protein [Frankia sp. AiPs1]
MVAAASLWSAGCWIRAGLLAAMWVTLCWMPADELLRAAACLTVATAGVLLAFTHTSEEALDRLDRLPGAGRLAAHLSTTQGRATVDASGLAEGLGMALATTLYVGVTPVHGLPAPLRTAGAVLAIGYVWDAVLQAVIDPGWYNREQPPDRGMRIFRPTIPVILAGLVTAFVWPWSDTGHEVPSAVLVLLAASPLLYYPAWAAFDVLLRSSAAQVLRATTQSRESAGTDIHSLIKSPLVLLHQHVLDREPELAEIRRLSWAAILNVEAVRRDLSGVAPPLDAPQTFDELWRTFTAIVPATDKPRMTVDAASMSVVLSPTDFQLTQRVLPDLATNALRSGASEVSVACRKTIRGGVREVHVEVTDNGPGIAATTSIAPTADGTLPGHLPGGPAGSLRALEAGLRRYDGAITLVDRSATGARGTWAHARWREQDRIGLRPVTEPTTEPTTEPVTGPATARVRGGEG